jgi:RimJ/RimL family protein N-acetyltransferase
MALFEDRRVGDCSLHFALYGWSQHVGQIRIVIAREMQKTGLGTIMIREAVRIGMEKGLSKLQADIIEDQKGAVHAFKKAGFRQEAVLKNHVKDHDGKERNLVILKSNINDIWHELENLYWEMDTQSG